MRPDVAVVVAAHCAFERGPQAPLISIIVPVLNEGAAITALLVALAPWRAAGDEVIVVDGGSDDDTVTLARAGSAQVLVAPRGRARQMNAGAAQARGRILWFLHADTLPAPDTRAALLAACHAARAWGRCAIRIDDAAPIFRVIAGMMDLRSRLTAIATGDQGIFVTRELFECVGGYPALALMEDLELSKRLARHARPHCLSAVVVTSARRWRAHGVLRTIGLMWALRLAWFCGVSATRLARWYGYRVT